ncbi:MAG: RnfABCDGE type electron transport complex subunit D [Nitrospiraceae bacterium]|nr:RnfABCDGE type electron transport complex subunit D [Nitrospiraceae bacterium]
MSTNAIMRNVAVALAPVALFSIFAFGLSALLLLSVATISCVLTEWAVCRLSGKPNTVGDYSAAVTGLLLGLTLPPSFPLWMVAVGGAISIGLGKALFGGLGYNTFNPALVGRAFLQAAFPVAVTTWTPPFVQGRFLACIPSTLAFPFLKPTPVAEYIAAANIDAFTGATPLNLEGVTRLADPLDLFMGMTSGSTGETCAVLILLCGGYLLVRNMLDWRIPAGVLGSVFALSGVLHLINADTYPGPLFMVFSGGLMLGAIFMATDMVTSPTTALGVWIFSILIGVITVVIRLKGSLPEGVMYAILLANAVTPLIETWTQPRVFGTTKKASSTS